MDAQALIIWLTVGAIAGWLAGMVVNGGGYGLIGDIIVGIVGGLIAGWLLPQIGIAIGGGFIAAIINAFIGAVILLIVLLSISIDQRTIKEAPHPNTFLNDVASDAFKPNFSDAGVRLTERQPQHPSCGSRLAEPARYQLRT